MKSALIAIAVVLATTSARAQDGQLSYSSEILVMLLSAEQACDLSYEKAAIEQHVKHFTDERSLCQQSGLWSATSGSRSSKKMSSSTLIAHCAQVRATAKLKGLSSE
ncbi:hypothetical protein ACVWZ3_007147 [Bradyrhizobium sp. i1.3.6]